MAADPIEAMREAISDALLPDNRNGSMALIIGEVDLNKVARAAWKLALDHLEGDMLKDWADQEVVDYLSFARGEILPI